MGFFLRSQRIYFGFILIQADTQDALNIGSVKVQLLPIHPNLAIINHLGGIILLLEVVKLLFILHFAMLLLKFCFNNNHQKLCLQCDGELFGMTN